MKKNVYGTQVFLEGQWNAAAGVMGANFPRKRTSILQSFQCVGSRILEKGGRCTIHFSADPSNAEILFRTINFANQLSIYGAIADWCDELTHHRFLSILFKHGEIRCESE